MTLLRLSPTALSRCRFALSPLAETLGTLITLQRPCTAPWLVRWHTAHQAAYRAWRDADEVTAGLMSLVAATKWLPDVVTQPPAGGMNTRLEDELAEVARFSDDAVRSTAADAVAASWMPQDTRWLGAGGLGPRVAAGLEEGWKRFVAPDWPRRRAILERDIMHRTEVLAAHGWRRAIEGMTGRPWAGQNAIRFSDQHWPDRLVTEEGLVFVPKTARVGRWTCERPPRYALVYPAGGPAAGTDTAGRDALAALLGTGRARVVRELARPATSSQLAHVLGLSLGTVSAHLAVLRESGVVSRTRDGRRVVYRLTDRGAGLVALLADGPADVRPDDADTVTSRRAPLREAGE